ncbi:MAG: bifunctional UDP-N-acetylmuramoyl-tripeptide:D-alanyl-D-alanine ligase/alanine racemase [Bacteroidota bacterium]
MFTWSSKYPANLYITVTEKEDEKTRISAKYKNKDIEITIPFVDNASIENAIHGWCLMLYLGYSQEIIAQQFLKLASVAMRLELKQGINNCIIINDSYNSDLGSLSIALDFVKQQQQHNEKTLVLSDILQSGKDEHMLYREVSELIRRKEIDTLIGIGTAISRNRELFNMMESSFYNSTDEFLRNIHTHEFHNRAILLKGARQFEFERISNILQQKVHETVLEINLSAITRNLNYYKSVMKPSTKVMVMVKAFSYGSGIFEIASLLQFQRVDYLAVAFADEGVELRKAGITLPILVLNPEVQSYDIMIEHFLEPEIYSHRVLDLFIEAMNRNRINSFNVHVKIDTGMHRLGFVEDDIPELIEKLKTREQLKVRSVFSHLAAAGEKEHDSFTIKQIERFEKISALIMKELHYPIMRHILNSSGIERFPDAQFDMVRLGIGLYGVSNTCPDKLANVSTLRTSISQIKKIGPSETIGYSRSGKIGKTSVIATVPVGYADGLNRKLSNGNGKMLVNGIFAPIVGNICMDMCMLDITGIDAEEGDEVIVFGDEYRVNEIAKLLDTIPYEIMTGISRRVKRVYYHE